MSILSRLSPSGKLLALASLVLPLSSARYVDGGTLLPTAFQNGSIVAPFKTVQQGVDALAAASVTGGVVLIAPGSYVEAVTTAALVRLQALFLDQATGSPVTITSITATGNAGLDLVGITVTTVTTVIGGAVAAFQSTISTLVAPLSAITGRGSNFGVFGALSIFTLDNCVMSGLITLASTTATHTFSNGCTFFGAADIVGGAGTCKVQMDADSMFLFKNAANTFTNISQVIVRSSMARAAISVTVPVLLAGVLGEAASVSLVGTELEGTGTGTVITVQKPTAGITGGGGFLGWRVSVSNTVILQFIGPCTGGAQTFLFSKLTSGT